MDVDAVKIGNLKAGILPIWEPGLGALVERSVKEGRLHFTTDAAKAMQHGQVQFIAVGTHPPTTTALVICNTYWQHVGGVGELEGKTIAVWGLAFKPNIDDMRAAPDS